MRFIYNASDKEVKQLKYITSFSKKRISLKKIFQEAITLYVNVHYLTDNGYKICLDDGKGNKKYFGKDL